MERIELRALKKILDVPKTTPTPAIWHVTGLLLTSVLIDKRQLLYLKNILNRENDDWVKKMFNSLQNNNIGWTKQILSILTEYKLDKPLEEIEKMPNATWKRIVTEATEKRNKEKLLEMCMSRDGEKQKTKNLVSKLKNDNYVRRPCTQTLNKSRHQCRARVMAMYGMLDCGKNFKTGYRGKNCPSCNVLDDENHRINFCKKYKNINLFDSALKIDFNFIYLGNEKTTKMIVEDVCELWNLHNGNNIMYPALNHISPSTLI